MDMQNTLIAFGENRTTLAALLQKQNQELAVADITRSTVSDSSKTNSNRCNKKQFNSPSLNHQVTRSAKQRGHDT
ncbi:hypothetical protein L1987_82673 [Smallanthus sonchifolius]|uniref:Uncharacterized protein n=1 Tax=Smallanthus sonchifolius TaxID=185202 RepID=A0ACB8YBL5_9ASTR|nr:hypothetical protein L1987_82673 [Smallanthus sonchifolius]